LNERQNTVWENRDLNLKANGTYYFVTELERFKRWIRKLFNKAVSDTELRIILKMFMKRGEGDYHVQFLDKSQNSAEENWEKVRTLDSRQRRRDWYRTAHVHSYSVTAKLAYSTNLKRESHC
jgi:hypothetical protein